MKIISTNISADLTLTELRGKTVYIENPDLVETLLIGDPDIDGGQYPLIPSTPTFKSFIEIENYDRDKLRLGIGSATSIAIIVIIKDNPVVDLLNRISDKLE